MTQFTGADMMQAAFLVEPGSIEVRQVPVPEPRPGSIVVRVRAALTDGTDLKAYRRGHPQMPMPTRFGHEFSGDVVAVGDGVTAFVAGEPVMSVHSAPCSDCFWCRSAQEELCEQVMETKILGAYAEYVEVPSHIVRRNCFHKPAALSYAAAAFLEPLSCVVHSLELLGVREGEQIAVLGDGGFGLLHAVLITRLGAHALLVGRRQERLNLAGRMNAGTVIDGKNGDACAAVHRWTKGRGADAVVECTGNPEVWQAAPDYVRRGGRVGFFGGLPSGTNVAFSAARLHYDEVRLLSPFHFTPSAVRKAHDLLVSGSIDPLPLVTSRVPLTAIGEAFAQLDAGSGMKIAIEP